MAGPTDVLPIPQRLQAIAAQWDQLRAGFDDAALAARVAELEQAMGAPGFWDDQQKAAQVSAEHSRATRRLERWRGLASDVEDLQALAEMAEEDDSVAAEVAGQMPGVEERLAALEEERLFSGRYDAGDALVTVNAGAGGTDAQDWAEMVLRMMMRWAERRGLKVELLEASRGGGGGPQVGDLPRLGRERLRPVQRREGRAPAGAHVALRRCPPPPDVVRRARGRPVVDDVGEIEIEDDDLQIDTYRASGPAASTSTRPTRRCASPTARAGSSCSARTSARSRPTRTPR